MKKILLIIAGFCLLTVCASAQTPTTYSVALDKSVSLTEITAQDLAYGRLLQDQNRLLNNRKTALIITSAGLGTTLAGGIVSCFNGAQNAGAVITFTGCLGTLTGGIWLLVNEFKMIDNKRKVNDIIIKGIPGGVALEF